MSKLRRTLSPATFAASAPAVDNASVSGSPVCGPRSDSQFLSVCVCSGVGGRGRGSRQGRAVSTRPRGVGYVRTFLVRGSWVGRAAWALCRGAGGVERLERCPPARSRVGRGAPRAVSSGRVWSGHGGGVSGTLLPSVRSTRNFTPVITYISHHPRVRAPRLVLAGGRGRPAPLRLDLNYLRSARSRASRVRSKADRRPNQEMNPRRPKQRLRLAA